MNIVISIIIGYILDLVLGDPQSNFHPIRFIGWLIAVIENCIFKIVKKPKILSGMFLTIMVIVICYIIPFSILYLLNTINPLLKILVEGIFCYQIICTKALKNESMKVYKYLVKNDLANSRKYLSYIVGRDTKNLNKEQISTAVVETVAENTADGVVAPLLFLAIGGAPLGFMYKAINTLDSMVGYKNDKYILFGRFSAKLDDVVNFIPAIFSAYAMLFSTIILKLNFKNALYIYKRDKYNHKSPNSAKTEAVAAGSLGIMLGGDNYYFGKLVKKPTIGDSNNVVTESHIITVNKLMYVTSFVFLVVVLLVRIGVFFYL